MVDLERWRLGDEEGNVGCGDLFEGELRVPCCVILMEDLERWRLGDGEGNGGCGMICVRMYCARPVLCYPHEARADRARRLPGAEEVDVARLPALSEAAWTTSDPARISCGGWLGTSASA